MMKHFICSLACLLVLKYSFGQDSTTNSNYWIGKTIGNIPHLDYGLGDDRLGGAKMTYLDTNVVLKIIDSVGDNYKVQLSKYHSAYIYKTFVAKDSLLQAKPYYLTDKWRVYGDSLNDYMHIRLFDKLPYRSIQQVNPTRIVLDIFGAVSNTNWITQLSSAKEIKSAWYEQTEDDVMRVLIELNHTQLWGYHIAYDSTGLLVTVKRQKDKIDDSNFLVAVDAGHGGSNPGAIGVTSKIPEKTFTLQFAFLLQQELIKNGFRVMMTRTNDTTFEMTNRVLMLRDSNPDVLFSLHLNSDHFDTVSGVSTYYRYIGFKPLTKFVYDRMVSLGLSEYGNTGSFNFGLNGPTEFPNCLVEIAFLSNVFDEKKIMDEKFRQQVAEAIVAGFKDWLSANGIEPPKKKK